MKLKRHNVLTTTTETMSKVVEVMWDVEDEVIRVDLLDMLIRETHEERESS